MVKTRFATSPLSAIATTATTRGWSSRTSIRWIVAVLAGGAVASASNGLGYRNLGAVGVVGPLRMDYARAIDSVRDAAGELSRFFATVYEG